MTELESKLLEAFEALQKQHEAQQTELLALYKDLEERFNREQQEKKALHSNLTYLIEQVKSLTQQLQQLKR